LSSWWRTNFLIRTAKAGAISDAGFEVIEAADAEAREDYGMLTLFTLVNGLETSVDQSSLGRRLNG
jgi:hypothetical protein